jgi:tetratricopeptide (TPR) repeat protein
MRRLSSVLFVVVIMLVCAASRADEPDAKELFTRGHAQYALGHFKEAAELFEKAFELRQDPAILYNAAQAHRLAGEKKQALILYQNYLRLFGEQENRDEVEKRIAELKAAIEAERVANTNPPTGLMNGKSEATEPTTAPPTTTAPIVVAPPATTTVVQEAPPRKKHAWVWGVVAGGVVVVGGAIALGIVFGSSHQAPAVTLGTVKAN